MDIIELNDEILNTRIPNNNIDYYQKLKEEQKNNYVKMYYKYSILLVQYMILKYDLKSCDDIIKNNKNRFEKVKKENMDIYQYLSSNFLDYIYIRNNIYIERLTKEEINYLYNLTDTTLNEQNKKFIEKTYLRVILENPNSKYNDTMFGPDNLQFIQPGSNIIIGIRYDDYSSDIVDENEWLESHESKVSYMEFFVPLLERQLNEIDKNNKVSVIEYNDFSIRKIPILK